jgi:hypothetical protein
MNSPQQPRKASQTARGFNREHRGDTLHVPMPPHPSAQADIAFPQPRIHSPWLAGRGGRVVCDIPGTGAAATSAHDRPHPGRVNPRLEQRKASQTARGFNPEHRGDARHVPMPRNPSAQADIAFSQPRIHSPGLAPRPADWESEPRRLRRRP